VLVFFVTSRGYFYIPVVERIQLLKYGMFVATVGTPGQRQPSP